MTEPTSLASWTRALRKQLDALGLDSAALCIEAGLDPQQMEDPECALSAVGDHAPVGAGGAGQRRSGNWVARVAVCQPYHFHALGYALVASGSLREVFERIVRYHQVVSDALKLELSRTANATLFRLLQPQGSPAPALEAIDAFAAIYVRTCRNRLGRDYAPLAVHLRRPEPADPKPWHTVFRAPVFLAPMRTAWNLQPRTSTAIWTTPTPSWPNTTKLCSNAPRPLQPLTWERKVRATIEAQLPDGEPSAERIAQALHFELRSLQRHLADEGCRFDALLERVPTEPGVAASAGPAVLIGRNQPFVGVCRYQQF